MSGRWPALIALLLLAAGCPERPQWHSWFLMDAEEGCLRRTFDGPKGIPERCMEWAQMAPEVSYQAADGTCWVGPALSCDLPDGIEVVTTGPCARDAWIDRGVCCDGLVLE